LAIRIGRHKPAPVVTITAGPRNRSRSTGLAFNAPAAAELETIKRPLAPDVVVTS